MKSTAFNRLPLFLLTAAAMIAASSCSIRQAQWKDNTIELGLEAYVPHFLSEIKYFTESESGELTVEENCFIIEDWESPMCYSTGENSRFEMRHYGANQAMGISCSLVYYFDGTEKRLVDFSGDNVFSNFALCDGERLCYLVSDGTLRVLEKDGGRTDYENAFDCEKINLGYHLEEIKLYAEGNSIVIEQYGYFGSQNDISINGELPIVRSAVELDNSSEKSGRSDQSLVWSGETCPTFDTEGITGIPQYIDQNKKVRAFKKVYNYNGELYYHGINTVEDGGYIVLDSVKCYSTGENEGFAVKAYRYECDEGPLCFEICRYENGKLKLLAYSGDSRFSDCFMCDGRRLCYIVDGNSLRVIDKDGGQTDYGGFEENIFGSSAQLLSEDGKTVIVEYNGEQIAAIIPE